MARIVSGCLVLLLSSAAGCASIIHGPDRAPTAQEVAGLYRGGHLGTAETWVLHADGAFSRTLHGHLGQAAATFAGTWSLNGKALLFQESPRSTGSAERIEAEVFFYKRKPAFARAKHITGEKVDEWRVFKRVSGS